MELHLPIFISISLTFLCLQALPSGNETDRLSLLKFKEAITDPNGIFNSWNSSLPFCRWPGVTCSPRHHRVTSLTLTGHNLTGSISPYIGNLSFLRFLHLGENAFYGPIPQEIGKLFRLNSLIAGYNSLSGEIPSNISYCNQLKTVGLSFNRLEGRISPELGSLAKLEFLNLGVNNIGGRIPTSLANLSSLTSLTFARNNLVGNIPSELAGLKKLTFFMVSSNHLSGNVPPELFNISSIVFFSTAGNFRLNGTIPGTIGDTLPNLEEFYMGGNEFSGAIPNSLSNASNLQRFDININNFEGNVPNFGNQPNLTWLGVAENFLGSNSSNDLMSLASLTNSTKLEFLGLANNNFGGDLPSFIANLSTNLDRLHLGGNRFTGAIPEGLQNFVSLIDLRLESNFFTGVIPSSFGNLQKLQRLLLWGNRFSGEIPSSLGNLTRLFVLSLSENNLTGRIPSSIGNLTSLNSLVLDQNKLEGGIPREIMLLPGLTNYLILTDNSLSGNLPVEVGKLVNLNFLDVSKNMLSGEIPTSIGDCLALENLYMQGNYFRGAIPSTLASPRGLQRLDLSRNNLTGEIPSELQDLPFMQYLNLSLNNLQGEVPTKGVFENVTALSLSGNSKLCGGIKELLLRECASKSSNKGVSRNWKIAIIVTSVVLGCLFVVACVFVHRRKQSTRPSSTTLMMDLHDKVSYQDLHRATNGFSQENLIGSGSSGSVYKGHLKETQKPIAVKVLKLQRKDALKTLVAESSVLKNVKHRNLVKLLSYCSSLDYRQNEFKALIFEFMENGSLDKWLHHDSPDQVEKSNFVRRLTIAIDVASALHYLHDLYGEPIVHCDVKPSNVLLDANMVAHVSDFGLARFLSTKSEISSIGIRGTIGYAPPEYATGRAATREGDVYSYGILLLEIFTRKRPTDEMFKDGLNIRNFVENAIPARVMQIVDQALIVEELDETNEKWNLEADLEKLLVTLFEVGIACSMESPRERTKMVDVVKQLHSIRSSFLGDRIKPNVTNCQ